MDLALQQKKPKIAGLLLACGGTKGEVLSTHKKRLPLKLFEESFPNVSALSRRLSEAVSCPKSPGGRSVTQRCSSMTLQDVQDGLTLVSLPDRLQQCINFKLDQSGQ